MTIEEYLEQPYWVIDILPKQVPVHSRGQYFRIEGYYRAHPQIDAIYRKFANILLKLNCYEDLDVSTNGEEWVTNPAPEDMEAMVSKTLSDKTMCYIVLKSAEVMVTLSGDDTYMTVYHPSEEILQLISSLVVSENLYLWKPL